MAGHLEDNADPPFSAEASLAFPTRPAGETSNFLSNLRRLPLMSETVLGQDSTIAGR
jgi:hypothetical protein